MSESRGAHDPQVYAPSLWPPPANLMPSWSSLVSMVIVRHPMSRLASVYYQKFVEKSHHRAWVPFIKIMRWFRGKEEQGPDDQPTPNEFIRWPVLYIFSHDFISKIVSSEVDREGAYRVNP